MKNMKRAQTYDDLIEAFECGTDERVFLAAYSPEALQLVAPDSVNCGFGLTEEARRAYSALYRIYALLSESGCHTKSCPDRCRLHMRTHNLWVSENCASSWYNDPAAIKNGIVMMPFDSTADFIAAKQKAGLKPLMDECTECLLCNRAPSLYTHEDSTGVIVITAGTQCAELKEWYDAIPIIGSVLHTACLYSTVSVVQDALTGKHPDWILPEFQPECVTDSPLDS
jgi:hypothetical protein